MENIENCKMGCDCCKDANCCGNGSGCECAPAGCRACNRFRGLCWIHKIFRFVFAVLVFLALLKFVCGGHTGFGRRGYNMMYMSKPGCAMMEGKGNGSCPMMKGGMMPGMMGSGMMSGDVMFQKRIERRSMWDRWFGGSDDKAATVDTTEATPGATQ